MKTHKIVILTGIILVCATIFVLSNSINAEEATPSAATSGIEYTSTKKN